jgi:hypothetical protein
MPPFENTATLFNPPPIPLSAAAWNAMTELPLNTITLTTMDFTPSTPYMINYHLTLQREVLPDTVVSASYVGSRGVYLVRKRDWNIRGPNQIIDGEKFFPAGLPRRNPNFGSITRISTDGNSYYNGMLLGVVRRLRNGLQLQANYTFSRAIDTASEIPENTYWGTPSRPQDPDDSNSLRGLSDFHVKHRFALNWSYLLPWGEGLTGVAAELARGWQLSGILTLASGPPFSTELGFDRARTGELSGQRPNVVPGFSTNPILGGVDQYFDINAFELQPAGFYGDLGRNTMEGPGAATVDLSVVKQFLAGAFGGSSRIEFRAEFFNLLNRANFRPPSGSNAVRAVSIFNSRGERLPARARLTDTSTAARQVQFGLKVLF